MREASRVRMNDVCSVRTSDTSRVGAFAPLVHTFTLADNRHRQQANDASQDVQALTHAFVASHMPSSEEPGPRLSRRTQRVLVETATIASRTPRVRFGVIRAYRPECTPELIGHVRSR